MSPHTDNERLFISFAALFSSGFFAYILNKINQMITESNQQEEAYKLKLLELNSLLISSDANQSIQQAARQYLEYIYQQKEENMRSNIELTLGIFPPQLREQIQKEIYSKMIARIPFLTGSFTPKFLDQLSLLVREQTYAPNEPIFCQHKVHDPRLYYIHQGEVELFAQLSNSIYNKIKQLQILTPSDYFGQEQFMLQQKTAMYNARSRGVSTIYYIDLQDFLALLRQFQDVSHTRPHRSLAHETALRRAPPGCRPLGAWRMLLARVSLLQDVPPPSDAGVLQHLFLAYRLGCVRAWPSESWLK